MSPKRLLRRADTLDRKAGELFSLVLAGFGEESHLSDLADNLIDATEQLAQALAEVAKGGKR